MATPLVDLKQMVTPVLFHLGFQPETTSLSFARYAPASARRALLRRVDVTCIRLI